MNWLFESPILILAVGVVAVAILSAALVQTGRRSFLYWAGAMVVLTASMLLVERLVVTDVEQITAMLHGLSDDLSRNDHPAVLEHISVNSSELRRQAEQVLNQVEIESASIKRNLKVSVPPNRQSTVATASFNAVITASDRQSIVTDQPYPRFFILDLRKEDGRWRVTRYEHHDPREGLRAKDET
jgi:hypothetical protein